MTTITSDELRAYLNGLKDSGALDGYAYAEIVTPALVLALLDRIDTLEADKGGLRAALEERDYIIKMLRQRVEER